MERTDGVETFLGIDAHGNQCSIKGVSRQGDEVLEVDVKTTAASLRKAVTGLDGPVWAMIESSSIAPFVKDSIEKHVALVMHMKRAGLLGQVLLSHDAGWYHVGKPNGGQVRPFDTLFTTFV